MSCLFCKIVAGELAADVVLDEPEVLAFRDIQPAAPSHVLVIPKNHIASLAHAEPTDAELLGRILLAARKVAETEGILESGFRTVFNNGRDAKQSVDHLHLHVLGRRTMGWPPG